MLFPLTTIFLLALGCSLPSQNGEILYDEINSYGGGAQVRSYLHDWQKSQEFEERLRQPRPGTSLKMPLDAQFQAEEISSPLDDNFKPVSNKVPIEAPIEEATPQIKIDNNEHNFLPSAIEPEQDSNYNGLRFSILGESHSVSHFGNKLIESLNEFGEVHRLAIVGSSTHTWLSQNEINLDAGYIRDSFDSQKKLIGINKGDNILISHSLLKRYLKATNPNVIVIQLMDNQLFDSSSSNIESVSDLVRFLKTYESEDQPRACFYITTPQTSGETSYPKITNDVKRAFINDVLKPALAAENCELINSMELLYKSEVSTIDGIHLDRDSGSLWGLQVAQRIFHILENSSFSDAVPAEDFANRQKEIAIESERVRAIEAEKERQRELERESAIQAEKERQPVIEIKRQPVIEVKRNREDVAERMDTFDALLKAERSSLGASTLQLNPALTRAAWAHAKDMAENNYFSHTGRNGSRLNDRTSAAGYCLTGIAENIAKGQRSEAEVFAAWMNSPGHRRNIQRASSKEYGLARFNSVWVMKLGDGCR